MQSTILLIIQITLIIGIISMSVIYTRIFLLKKINLKEKFKTGFFIGLITDIGDTLGIGSFATTTAAFKATKFIKDDRNLPGTLNAAHSIPVFFQALLFITTVKVDITTLVSMTISAVLGAYIGPMITKNWDENLVQKSLSIALFVGALIIIIRTIIVTEHNSTDKSGLTGWILFIGILLNFILGILMTIGLGNYAPSLIFFTLIGVNPAIAFPVMMLDSALIMPIATIQFIKQNKIQWVGLFGIIIGGVVGVFIAVYFIKSLPVQILNWLVIGVALFSSYSLWKENKNSY